MAESDNFSSINDGNNHRVSNVAEFYNDVHVYGKLYADLVGGLTGDGDGTLEVYNLDVKNNVNIDGDLNVEGLIDTDYLTVFQRLNVGAAGTIFVAISTTNGRDGEGQIGGRVGVGTTQPTGRFEVGIGGEGLDPEDPADPFKSIFIIHPEGGVGIGTTAPAGKFQVGVDCLTITEDCRVGLGTTQPTQRFQVKDGTVGAVISDAGQVGVRTSMFEGTEVFKVNSTDKCFVITDDGNVGIGSLDPTAVPNYNTSDGIIKLNVEGTVKIDRNIIDSADSPGQNGYYLARDGNGIRWVQASPLNLDGMYVQDEGSNLPVGGTAQLFQYLNFSQLDSQGLGVDTLIPIPDPANPTTVAKIQTQDLWGHTNSNNNSPIYRMTRVGIKNQSPAVELDVTGEVHATGPVDFDDTFNVDGDTTLNAKLDVDGLTTFNDGTDSTSTTTGSVQMDGGLGIVKRLNIGGQTRVYDTTDASSCTTGALIVSGGVGIAKKLFVCGDTELEKLTIDDTTESVNCTTGALVVKGGVGIGKNVNICGEVDIVATTQSTDKNSGALVVEGGVGIEKNLNVGQNTKLTGTLELENQIIDKFDSNGVGACKTDYRLSTFDVSGVGVGVSWRPPGVQTKRTIWVTKNGCDINSGLLEGDAKYTIAAAAAIAQMGDTIKVRSGVYYENNPIGLRTDVAISGEDLRLVTVVPNTTDKDLFHVRNGCLVENMSFKGADGVLTTHHGLAAVAFPPTDAADQAVGGYIELGPSNEGPRGRYQSPYVRNCTNFMTGSIGMKIDGNHVNAAYTGTNDLGQDIKSMVCDSFTQYNEAGIGVSITNKGYAQLVSIFTIGCEKAIYVDSGGQCDLTNSNSSFGTFGLVADGTSGVEFDGTLAIKMEAEADQIVVANSQDLNNNNRTPFDGQGAYFHLDMSDYADTISTDIITAPMQTIRGLTVVNGGNPGDYAASAPPLITATLPLGPEAIIAEFSPNVSAAGTITSVDVIASGRNFLPTQNVVISISGTGNAQLVADMDPILYTVDEATEVTNSGQSTVIFNEFIPYEVKATAKVEFVRLSRIITSSHSFEYVGAGVDLNTANPFQAGKPVPENEVVAINGGQVPFTSTDQKGNFRIGDGLTIDQTTSTIRGRDFNRAIQAQLTPLILALR